jgi:hypothetical protein
VLLSQELLIFSFNRFPFSRAVGGIRIKQDQPLTAGGALPGVMAAPDDINQRYQTEHL